MDTAQVGTYRPSRTALSAARYRAEHQLLDKGHVFSDPFANAILGSLGPETVGVRDTDNSDRRMRFFIASRSRFAEDGLAAAVARGVDQVVVLGAGLDTLALRNPFPGARIFEVDQPATQKWKRERLAAEKLGEPPHLTFVPVDFEKQKLGEELEAAGYRLDRAGYFIWLGVVPYLTKEAIFATLAFVAGLPGGEIAFDYGEPADMRDDEARESMAKRAARVAALGEPWLSFFTAEEIAAKLRELGFDEIEDLDSSDIAVRYFGAAPGTVSSQGRGGHLIRARRLVCG